MLCTRKTEGLRGFAVGWRKRGYARISLNTHRQRVYSVGRVGALARSLGSPSTTGSILRGGKLGLERRFAK